MKTFILFLSVASAFGGSVKRDILNGFNTDQSVVSTDHSIVSALDLSSFDLLSGFGDGYFDLPHRAILQQQPVHGTDSLGVPVPVTITRKIPVEVPLPQPVAVEAPKPALIPVEKEVPVQVGVSLPVPIEIPKPVPIPGPPKPIVIQDSSFFHPPPLAFPQGGGFHPFKSILHGF